MDPTLRLKFEAAYRARQDFIETLSAVLETEIPATDRAVIATARGAAQEDALLDSIRRLLEA